MFCHYCVPHCRFFLFFLKQKNCLFLAGSYFPQALLALAARHVTQRQTWWQILLLHQLRRPPADVGGEEGQSESGCGMKMGCVCLTVRRGREEAGGWGARSASSENMLEAGMQEECWHSPGPEEADLCLV